MHAFLKLVRGKEFVRPCTVIWDECFQPNMYMHSRMVQLRHLPDVQWIFCGDHLQSQLQGCWRGAPCRNNLWGSSLLPLDVVELHQNHRTDDPRLLAFWKETRAATPADLLDLKRKAIEQFRAPPPYDTQLCLSHAKRRCINREAVGEGVAIECDDGDYCFCLLYTSPSPRDRG